MWRYTIKRLIQGVITVWFIATATFLAMHAVPGDPMSGDRAVSAEIRKSTSSTWETLPEATSESRSRSKTAK